MNEWWAWIENFSRRDQLSLTYCLWRNGFKAYILNEKPCRCLESIKIRYDGKHK